MKIVLFLVVLGVSSTIQIKSVLLLFGVLPLVDYAHRVVHLTKKEIISWIVPAMVIGLIVTMLPYIFAALLHT